MHFHNIVTTLFLVLAASVFAVPVGEVDLLTLNFPSENFTALLNTAADHSSALPCPASDKCGVVTFQSGQYVGFGEGICMPISGSVLSIYVAHCYCSIWNKCTSTGKKTDVYVGGMMMCQQPQLASSFSKEPKFISCGGRKAGLPS
ncbi:hypothetical protein N0V83_001373 [Neocucurbitaria cava]|uniref:Uncharacterized protein n=1 Tax=Neocucurbitaria cava TaxID=798079 RepID=A0A9W8YG25_9PLEO|nr:hypothetical protein N0V83_001373 [Neocucurbitaria cava]